MSRTNVISVVDNDESIRDSTRALLRSVGYTVATFESGELFLASGAVSDTECLILDMRMPGMNGLELQRQLNVVGAGVPIIFITAHDNRTDRQLAKDAGAFDFFQKPFAARDLLAAIQAALRNSPEL